MHGDSGGAPQAHLFPYEKQRIDGGSTGSPTVKAGSPTVKPVRTVGEAAERLGTDTGTLYAYFRDRIGLDFRTWRTRLRLEDAKRMLADNPLLPPADAARLCGFSNRSNFSRQFLAYTGQTPAEWQRDAGASSGGLRNRSE